MCLKCASNVSQKRKFITFDKGNRPHLSWNRQASGVSKNYSLYIVSRLSKASASFSKNTLCDKASGRHAGEGGRREQAPLLPFS